MSSKIQQEHTEKEKKNITSVLCFADELVWMFIIGKMLNVIKTCYPGQFSLFKQILLNYVENGQVILAYCF